MSCRVDTTPLLAGACVVSLYAGHGVRGDQVPSTGTHGPSPLYNDLSLPADAAKEYRWGIVTPPAVGTLVVYEDGSYGYTPPGGTVDLTASYTYRLWQDGVDLGTASESIVIGAGSGVGDVTPPTLTGAISVAAITSTSYTLAWPAGSDNVAVTSYERSIDGGSTWLDVGNVLTVNVSGRTPGATDVVQVRAKDAAGNVSNPPLTNSVTLLVPGVPTITTEPFSSWAGAALSGATIPRVLVINPASGGVVLSLSSQVTNGSARLVISDASLTPGVPYLVVAFNADGTARGIDLYTAA